MMHQIEWRNERTPVSKEFDDIYFAVEDGLQESRYVFLQQNLLPERFLEAPKHRIAELGFGTGLNFLVSLQSFRGAVGLKNKLQFYSCEKFPLSKEDLQRSLGCWPELEADAAMLLEDYQPEASGFSIYHFENSQIELNLFIGDVTDFLKELSAMKVKIDTWYFDGFAPKKNPDMWSPEVFQNVATLSQKGTRFATFASAGFVRRGLLTAGFMTEKAKGFGRKREMLKGFFDEV